MKSNPSAGIILLLLGAGVIAVGTTDKGKEIINIITGGTKETTLNKYEPNGEAYDYSGTPNDPDYIPPQGTSNLFGFNGEKGANYVG